MTKFFRKIRQKLLAEKRLRKYLLYAIGEIVLVVIGILIALQINNANEQKKAHDKYLSVLREIQIDPFKNIEAANRVIDFYIQTDSLAELILNNKLTYDDYANDQGDLRQLIVNTSNIRIQNNGYLKLTGNSALNVQADTELMNIMNENYIYNKFEVDRSITRLD